MFDSKRIEKVYEKIVKPSLKVISLKRLGGMTSKNIARALGITEKTFMDVMAAYEDVQYVYMESTKHLVAKLRDVVFEDALGVPLIDKSGEPVRDGETGRIMYAKEPNPDMAYKLLMKFDKEFKSEDKISVEFKIEDAVAEIAKIRKNKIEGLGSGEDLSVGANENETE